MPGRTNPKPTRRPALVLDLAPRIIVGLFLITLPLFMPSDLENMFTKVLIFGILALSLDLIFGYGELWSLGHAAFFGVAGYTVAILTLKAGIESFWLVAPCGILMAGLIAAVFGFVALRVSGVYFMMITLALGELVTSIVWKWPRFTGGSDGLPGIPPADFGFPWEATVTNVYYLILVVFVLCFLSLYLIINSPFGYSLRGIGQNELRMRSLGYNTWVCRYVAYVLAGLFAGVAGVLFAYSNGFVHPNHIGVPTSVSVLIMIVIGGSKTLSGPIVGAGVILLVEYISSIHFPERWPLILGTVFVGTVMFARGGIMVQLAKISPVNRLVVVVIGLGLVAAVPLLR